MFFSFCHIRRWRRVIHCGRESAVLRRYFILVGSLPVPISIYLEEFVSPFDHPLFSRWWVPFLHQGRVARYEDRGSETYRSTWVHTPLSAISTSRQCPARFSSIVHILSQVPYLPSNIISYLSHLLSKSGLDNKDFFVISFVISQDTISGVSLNLLTYVSEDVNLDTFSSSCAQKVHREISISWIIIPFSNASVNFSNLLPSSLIWSSHCHSCNIDVTFLNLCLIPSSNFGLVLPFF